MKLAPCLSGRGLFSNPFKKKEGLSMATFAVVSSKNLGNCREPEALAGRIRLAEVRVKNLLTRYEKAVGGLEVLQAERRLTHE